MLTPNRISLICFIFLLVVGWGRSLPRWRRIQASLFGFAGIVLILLQRWGAGHLPATFISVVADWLPALLMLLVYWQAGRLVREPNVSLQAYLHNTDRVLFKMLSPLMSGTRLHAFLSNFLELAYLFCYPLVPIGVAILYFTHMRNGLEQYWTAVLSSACFCYVATIFSETLSPRAIPAAFDFHLSSGRIRALNLLIVRYASIQINTFPSAHVAAAVAAALVLMRFAPVAGLSFLFISAGIAAGAVAGRYHYILDVVLGAAIAVVAVLLTAYVG
jgi:membrane-associated phospholipid phosphatase